MNCSLSISIPHSWGPHVRAVVITIVIVVAVLLGVDFSLLPLRV
ncbi:hypothetical protein ACIBI7_50545 [Nonomuraea fuscirosea]